ncbi:hypothetical protein KAR91_36155 [Candidatus Pacearchaeota archaeon]|nr:hypothetical protein [Candidatus Pacearchaeota archaeon]
MATILDTLITRFGFETDKSGLDKAEKGLKDFKSTAIKFAAGIGAILGGGFILNQIAETADETIKWADANGLAVESLGELEFATQRQGGTVDGLRSSLSNLNKSIGEVERGTGRAKLAFEDYDISIEKADGTIKTADELLIDLNKKFATLSRAQQFDLAMKMGIDKGTILLLQTAPEAIADLRLEAAKLGVLSRRDAARAAEFVDGMTNIAQAINAIKFELAGFLFKPLADFFKLVANGIAFFRKHKEILLIMIGILGSVGAAYVAMGIKAAAAWIAALGPFSLIPIAIGAAGIALAILMEDLFAFFSGSQSAIGDFLKNFPKVEALFLAFGDLLGKSLFIAIEFLKEMWNWLVKIGDGIIEFFIDPIGSVNRSVEKIPKLFSIIWDWLTKIGDGIIEFLQNPIDSFIESLRNIPGIDKISGFLNVGDKRETIQSFNEFSGAGPVGAISPANPILTRSNSIVRQNTDIKIGELKVDARGGDSKEIADNVGSALKEQLQNTVEDFDSSIDK